MLCYFVNYLDRVNVGFAKLTMDADLGLSDTAFGCRGIFFLAYFLFEALKRHYGPCRRTHLDRANYDFMGHNLGRHGLYPEHRSVDGL